MAHFGSLNELLASDARPEHTSDWYLIDQARIAAFAEATDDRQWIHLDTSRAAEGPYGTTIAHGNLTLSMIDGFRLDLVEVKGGFSMGVNYGWNKVRFPAPVPSGSKVRASAEMTEANDLGNGWLETVTKITVEVQAPDGTINEKPCCVGESVTRLLKA